MSSVLVEATLSLDGFMAGPGVGLENPMGVGGHCLHSWMSATDEDTNDARIKHDMAATTGPVVLGRRTFDVGVGIWQDTPFAVPCFVLTHRPADERVERSGTFTFVTDKHDALERARAAAGDKDVRLMGGECSQAFLEAGLVDEIRVQIAPVLMGAGQRLFSPNGIEPVRLERTSLADSPHVTHLGFRVAALMTWTAPRVRRQVLAVLCQEVAATEALSDSGLKNFSPAEDRFWASLR